MAATEVSDRGFVRPHDINKQMFVQGMSLEL